MTNQQYDASPTMPQLQLTYLTEKEAAAYLSMSTSFLRKARSTGPLAGRTEGPPYLKVGRAIRYKITDLDAWMTERRHR